MHRRKYLRDALFDRGGCGAKQLTAPKALVQHVQPEVHERHRGLRALGCPGDVLLQGSPAWGRRIGATTAAQLAG